MPVSVLEYLEKSALIYPDSPAFCSVSEQLTFGQLREQAQILGWKIRDSIKQDSSPLAVLLMERQPHAVTALAGILYAGGSYVFLDPSLPEKRLKELMDFLKPDVCLADRKYLATAEHIWEKPLCLETLTQNATRPESPERSRLSEPSLSPERSRLSEQPLSPEQSRLSEPSLSPEQTLCLTFTSSSSGQPKCVETSHLSVIRYIEGLSDILEADRQTVFGEQAPLFLDASLKEIYTTLKNGCQTWFLPEELFSDPLGLTVFLNEHAVNTICWVSSALHLFAVWDVFSELLPETLRTVAFGSESLPPESLAVWRAAFRKPAFSICTGRRKPPA